MIPAQVQVNIDENVIRDYINQQLDKQIHETLLLVDAEKLAEITSMSKRFLEEVVLSDPRVRIHERRKARKRWWLYKPTIQAIEEIVNEW